MRPILMMGLLFLAFAAGACSSTAEPPVVTAAAPAISDPPPPAAGVIGGPIGDALSEKDRAIAIAAQQDAVAFGLRKSWRGEKGSYGFVTPGAENGACRDYTHKVFVNGRPQEAKGRACRENGVWRITA